MAPFERFVSFVMLLIAVNCGGDVSPVASVLIMVTVKLAVAVFPAPSDAVHVTVVVPTENNVPDAGVQVGPLVTPILSIAVAAP